MSKTGMHNKVNVISDENGKSKGKYGIRNRGT